VTSDQLNWYSAWLGSLLLLTAERPEQDMLSYDQLHAHMTQLASYLCYGIGILFNWLSSRGAALTARGRDRACSTLINAHVLVWLQRMLMIEDIDGHV
jgi:hypothetical protein